MKTRAKNNAFLHLYFIIGARLHNVMQITWGVRAGNENKVSAEEKPTVRKKVRKLKRIKVVAPDGSGRICKAANS
jgi:hypothetical protein